MNWYHVKKVANFQLGQNLGKWLVLQSRGQFDPSAFQMDLRSYINQNPTGLNLDDARNSAVAFFTQQTGQTVGGDQQNMLDQWLSLVNGGQQDVSAVPVGLTETNGDLYK